MSGTHHHPAGASLRPSMMSSPAIGTPTMAAAAAAALPIVASVSSVVSSVGGGDGTQANEATATGPSAVPGSAGGPDTSSTGTGSAWQRRLKLSVYGATFSCEEVVLHADDLPKDQNSHREQLIQIYDPDEDHHQPRLLLKISAKNIYPLNGMTKPLNRETLFLDANIAETFKLQNFKHVVIAPELREDAVKLDSVELIFRDMYMGRSDMWRIKQRLLGLCLHMNKKIEICNDACRCQVNEMWAHGEKVACGVVTSDTKVIFRSPTAMVYLFIQISSEMWEYDSKGYLLFEKAINGFLSELFERWKQGGSSHEVTIVLFSRCFYRAKGKEDFPEHMRDCLQIGVNGEIYEDFYRVVVQNERFEDWKPTLMLLRKLFTSYKDTIVNYHCHEYGARDISKPIPEAEISTSKRGNFLEVLNMSLNTFENQYLNRNLDRTGQQSIVLTPGSGVFEVDWKLAQITKQRILDSGVGSDLICVGEYPLHAVPLLVFNDFSPNRIQNPEHERFNMPHWINLSFYSMNQGVSNMPRTHNLLRMKSEAMTKDNDLIMPFYKRPNSHIPIPLNPGDKDPFADTFSLDEDPVINEATSKKNVLMPRNNSFTSANSSTGRATNSNSEASSVFLSTPIRRTNLADISTSSVYQQPLRLRNQPSSRSEERDAAGISYDNQLKSLMRTARVNPFDPSDTQLRVSSNRRRWTHIFTPKNVPQDAANRTGTVEKAGMDWKSLTIPASLPITTDYLPDRRSFSMEYFFNEYRLNPIDINDGKPPLSTKQIFQELICQRLAQGFQLIMASKGTFPELPISALTRQDFGSEELWLSIGEIFHKITLAADLSELSVTKNQPKKPLRDQKMDYRYRFQAPDNDTYEISWVEFKTEKLENFNWNLVDCYVCTRGDKEYSLTPSQKYWRIKFHLIPLSSYAQFTKKIVEGSLTCDIYPQDLIYQANNAQECFSKFVETCLNRLRRKPRASVAGQAPQASETKWSTDKHSPEELCAAMASTVTGVNQFTRGRAQVFLAFDAVDWLKDSVVDIETTDQALNLLRLFMSERLVRHVSKCSNYSLTYSIAILEFVSQSSPTSKHHAAKAPSTADMESNETDDWIEIQLGESKNVFHKISTIDIDQSNRSDRPEWGHIRYLSHFDPRSAFELSMQWTVATGALVAELLLSWSRKAQQNNLSLIPVPGDPFALPITPNSDPIRGPIFVALDASGIVDKPDTSDETLFRFRQAIARKFGFISCSMVKKPHSASASFSTEHQHIHCTGNMYLLIPTKMQSTSGGIQGMKARKNSMDGLLGTSPEAPTVSSVVSGHNDSMGDGSRYLEKAKPSYDHSKTGFLWSWNFMISRRWKQACNTGATGDIAFMDKMLEDFRKFCANNDGRLDHFWEEWRAIEHS